MARTKQTARKSQGGKAPRKQLAYKVYMLLFLFNSVHQLIIFCSSSLSACAIVMHELAANRN